MNYEKKIKINDKIKNIIDKDLFYKIFKLLKNDLYNESGDKLYTENNNGIFFDLNKISDESLNKLEILLSESILNTTDSENIKYIN